MPKGRRGSGSSKKKSGDGGNNELETPLNDGGNNELERPLKKGTWTSEEDQILIDYVQRHGAGNWNAVQKNSGLSRCAKSCRLRWLNHLRPDLRKDSFTPEEEERLVELHYRLGNKWSCIASEMPGRTDNDVKNFWNTRLKRVHQTDEIRQKVQEAEQRGHNIDAWAREKVQSQCSMWSEGIMDIPEITFERMDYTSMSADLSKADNQMPPLGSEDTLNQSPVTGQTPSYSSPSMNNQLLESVLYQSHMLSDTLNQSPMTGQTPSYSSPSMNNQLLESVLYQSHMLSDAQSLGQEIDMLLQPSSLVSNINPISASSSVPSLSAGNNNTVEESTPELQQESTVILESFISADMINQLVGEDSGIESFFGLHQLDLGPFVF